MTDTVFMSHPDSRGVAETTRDAFDTVWSEKGWVEVEMIGDEPMPPGKNLSDLSKDELTELAQARGLDVAGMLKADIIAALEA